MTYQHPKSQAEKHIGEELSGLIKACPHSACDGANTQKPPEDQTADQATDCDQVALTCTFATSLQSSNSPTGPRCTQPSTSGGDWLLVSRHYRHGKDVQVGDIVRFRHPTFLEMQAAKRVVGMPGDFVCSDPPLSEDAGISTSMIQVPTGHAYVCGDNLPWSRDSRMYGPIPLGLINGKVVARVWPPWRAKWVRNSLEPAQVEEE
ncbi:mitochondrial inner membrane protease subunit 1 [Penicillium chermesinum]|nr:mitochondrial inner membrane protease subunit 1 [Penicillium chermesinum]